MTVGDIIGEPYEIHPEVAPEGRAGGSRVQDLLDVVGLNPEYINRYPHQFSGGQRQRIGIARGLALQPRDHRGGRARLRARRVRPGAGRQPAGPAAGRVRPVLHLHRARPVGRPAHLRPGRGDVPRPDRRDRHGRARSTTTPRTRTPRRCSPRCRCPTRRPASTASGSSCSGDVPSPANPPSGCRFRTRCWKAQERCALEVPLLAVPAVFRDSRRPARHDSACHFAEEKRVVPPEGLLETPEPQDTAPAPPSPPSPPSSPRKDPGGGQEPDGPATRDDKE